MERRVFGGSHVGLVRETNQDDYSVGSLSLGNIVYGIVCDGMGGQNGGNIASQIATEFAEKTLSRDLSSDMTELSIRAIFTSIFSASNALIHEQSMKDENLRGMGTTMIVAVIKDDVLFVGAVGDSRVYLASPTKEKQVTKDHTVVQMMIDIGEISPEEAIYHPKRHYITRAVGVADNVDMDFIVEPVTKEDIVLICSDGLYTHLDTKTLYKDLKQSADAVSVENLVNIANQGGGSDNITAVVML